jgi:general secretion pathway protein D
VRLPPRVPDAQGMIEMSFRNVEVLNFIQIMSQAMGLPMVWDEREIRGKITLVSPRRFNKADALRIFETVLDMHGFVIVRKVGSPVLQIIPSKDAARLPSPTRSGPADEKDAPHFVTQIITLRFADANQIRTALTPLQSRTAVVSVYSPANVLIVSDSQENVQRLLSILKELDVAPGDMEIAIIALKNASARRMAALIKEISGPGPQPGPPRRGAQPGQAGGGIADVRVVADERTNSIVLVGDPFGVAKAKEMLILLDVPGLSQDIGIRVFVLQHADAEELAKILREVRIPSDPGGGAGPSVRIQPPTATIPGAPGQVTATVPGSTSITADKPTNSLIVFGSTEFIQTIEEVVKKLDVRRPQVFVQALIMEMTLEKSLELGVRWQASNLIDGTAVGVGVPSASPQTLTDALAAGSTASIGILGNEIQFQGQKFLSFSAFIQATRQDQDLNVLANPQILTMNNEEAEINVSQVIPVSAKIVTNIQNQTTTEFEFKDVGVILKIKPQITGDDKVRLIINQESSSVAARQAGASTQQQAITTLKRKISTRVLVDDATTMAIGGLIQDQQVETETKVPCLGDIPVLGWFFKSRSESVRKTNLIVFIRPQIIHTREAGAGMTEEAQRRYDATQGLRRDTNETLRQNFNLPPRDPGPAKK